MEFEIQNMHPSQIKPVTCAIFQDVYSLNSVRTICDYYFCSQCLSDSNIADYSTVI